MALKVVVLAALVAVAKAGILGAPAVYAPGAPLAVRAYAAPAIAAAPIARAPVAVAAAAIDTDYDPNPQYSYGYDVRDGLTGDSKNQQETRSGDVVQGSYSLVEPDGTTRTVEYAADPVNGFNAVVHRTPAVAPVAATVAHAPVAVAAPARLAAAPALAYGAGLGYGLGGHLAAKGLIG